jgi:hypothetical protein
LSQNFIPVVDNNVYHITFISCSLWFP